MLVQGEWAQSFEKYKEDLGWKSVNANGYREGDFVESDGKTSPEEDFANNAEYFLFDPNVLKVKSPKMFEWLLKNLGPKLHLEKGCEYGK